MPSGHSATRVPAWQSQQQVSSPLSFENLRSPQGQLQSSGIDVTSDVPSLFLQVHVSVVPVWEQSEHVPSNDPSITLATLSSHVRYPLLLLKDVHPAR